MVTSSKFELKVRIIMISPKNSNQWIRVFILYTIVIFIGLLTTRVLFGSDILDRSIFSLLIISIVSALIPSIGGLLGIIFGPRSNVGSNPVSGKCFLP